MFLRGNHTLLGAPDYILSAVGKAIRCANYNCSTLLNPFVIFSRYSDTFKLKVAWALQNPPVL